MLFEYEIFDGERPENCIADCSASGSVDGAVNHWRTELDFNVNQDRARDCLKGYGAWTEEEIAKLVDIEVAEKILWLACCDFKEGTDVFVME